jgi:SPP1 gp7 family putative phage head morphogenesis protein
MAKKTSPIRESRKLEVQYRNSLLVRTNWLKDHQDQIINTLKSNNENFTQDASGTDITTKLNKLRAMYLTRFPIAMTQRLATNFYRRVEKYNKNKMNSSFNALGIDLESALKRENLKDFANIAIKNQVDLIKSISDEYFDKVEKITLNGMLNGTEWTELGKQIQKATGATAKRAKTIARSQVIMINSNLTKKRATDAGFEFGRWLKPKKVATKDYTPRKSHNDASGKLFKLSDGLMIDGKPTWPGQDYGCRCLYEIVVDK